MNPVDISRHDAHGSNPLHHSNVDRSSTVSADGIERITLSCNESIQFWLEEHSQVYVNERKESTFLDNAGVKRFLDTWRIVEEDIESKLENNVEDDKGISRVFFSTHAHGNELRYIKFLANWEKLWMSFEEDEADEIAAQAPLLRIFIEFFFHKRTAQLEVFLFFYNIFAVLICGAWTHNPNGAGGSVANTFLSLIQLLIYLSLKHAYSGHMLWEDKEDTTTASLRSERQAAKLEERRAREALKMATRRTASKKYSTHWFATVKSLFVRSKDEIKTILFGKATEVKQRGKHENFYNLINTSLKFLIVHNDAQLTKTHFNRFQYRLALLGVVSVVPIFVLYQWVFLPLKNCGFALGQGEYCDYIYYVGILTLCGFTVVMQSYIFIGSVLTGFVGLAYGGEIAYQLTNSWMQRFSDLRRVSVEVEGDSSKETVKKMFKAPVTSDPEKRRASECAEMEVHKPSGEFTDEDFSLRISRDAYEQHLFYTAYMKRASHLWSPVIAELIVYFLYMCSGELFFMLTSNQSRRALVSNIIFVLVRFIVLFCYPISSIAHANRYLFAIADTFNMAAPTDYAILGGQDNWASFLSDVPAVWTFFGLWITWDRIFAALWTMLSIAIGVAVTVFSARY